MSLIAVYISYFRCACYIIPHVAETNLFAVIAGTLGIPPEEVTDASDMTNTRK